ncbi:MAG: transposase [Niveispirillum sp.]|uniref:transposase n=1 Tax=Niveispirillum sp. TaxID=1917217 RepID=UPI0040350E0B
MRAVDDALPVVPAAPDKPVHLVDTRLLAQVLGVTERAVRLRAASGRWPSTTRPVRGGRAKVFPLSRLPIAIREAVLAHFLSIPPAASTAPAAPAAGTAAPPARAVAVAGEKGGNGGKGACPGRAVPPVPGTLDGWQRRCMEARAALLVHIRALAADGGLNAALRVVAGQARAGTLPSALAQLVPVANARAGNSGARSLSVPTLKRWWGIWQRAGCDALVLAPADVRAGPSLPVWAPAFLAAYRLPSKPSVPDAIARMDGAVRPSEGQARRFLSSLSAVERNKGRMGPAALKAIRPFVRRDTSDLEPLDVVIADGFTAKQDVAHPIHGRPFAPELTVVRCVATRRVIGWSAGLSESTWTVMDAYADAARKAGLWAIAYTDNGAGFRSKLNTGDLAGLQGRLGATHALGRPGNPQARGQIEKGWDRLFIRPAKALPAFRGTGMDPEARRRIVKQVERDISEQGRSDLLQSWAEFLRWAADCVAAYNAAPHSGLPRMTEAATGKRRHMSPDEAWQAHMARGWAPVRLSDAEAEDLFRPHLIRRVRRAEVALFNNAYFHPDLEPHHGEAVQVGFDIHDPTRVWVRSLSGALIAVAEAGGNSRPYFDTVRVQRARRRLRPVEAKRAEILAELDGADGPPVIEGEAVPVSVALAGPTDGERPAFFASDLAMYGWCAANEAAVTAHDRAYLAAAMADPRLARAVADHDRRHGTGLSGRLQAG